MEVCLSIGPLSINSILFTKYKLYYDQVYTIVLRHGSETEYDAMLKVSRSELLSNY